MLRTSEQGANHSAPQRATGQYGWKEGGTDREEGGAILGSLLEVLVKALEFPWSRKNGNLERVKQETDTESVTFTLILAFVQRVDPEPTGNLGFQQ